MPLTPGDGALIGEGLRVTNGRYVLQLRPSNVIPLTPSSETFSGPVSDRVLRLETECAILCAESLSETVARYLESVTRSRVHARRDDTLPAGWCLFIDIQPTTTSEPPSGLERLRVESSVALLPQGGLRLGRRWTWLEGAPAKLTVVGGHRGQTIRIDGAPVVADSEGCVSAASLSTVGQHVVEVGSQLRQRITVHSGTVHPECPSWYLVDSNLHDVRLVALPTGHWVVLGREPGRRIVVSAPYGGAVVYPHFTASWAVSVGAGPGAKALHLHTAPNGKTLAEAGDQRTTTGVHEGGVASRQRRETLAWAETVYQASIRRPSIACFSGCSADELERCWRRLFDQARSIKRRLRRHG